MIAVGDTLVLALNKDNLVTNVIAFLQAHVAETRVLDMLSNREACVLLWTPLLEDISDMPEHSLAVRLSYALSCQALNIKPALLEQNYQDAEVPMMMALETQNLVRFADWDG